MPMLLALAKPRFARFRTSFTSGKRSCTISQEPSVEALSTTMISARAKSASARADCRHCCKKLFAFQLTIMIERSRIDMFALEGRLLEGVGLFHGDAARRRDQAERQ